MIAAISHCHDRSADHSSRIVKNLSWFEYVAQMGESMLAEMVVAKRLGYDYQPGITWDNQRLMWANTLRSNGQPIPTAICGFKKVTERIVTLLC